MVGCNVRQVSHTGAAEAHADASVVPAPPFAADGMPLGRRQSGPWMRFSGPRRGHRQDENASRATVACQARPRIGEGAAPRGGHRLAGPPAPPLSLASLIDG
jgi:hypothetical protein